MINASKSELSEVINLLIGQSEHILLWLGSDFKIKFISESTKAIYGWNDIEVNGIDYFQLCQDYSIESIHPNVFKKVSQGEHIENQVNKIFNQKNQQLTSIQWDIHPLDTGKKNKLNTIIMLGVDLKNQTALQTAQAQIDGLNLVCASMAHELRTPLAGIKLAVYGINLYWPSLIESYQIAKQSHVKVPLINMKQLSRLKDIMVGMDKKVDHTNMVIDMLLTNLSAFKQNNLHFSQCSIQECIEQAIEKYIFNKTQRELVIINDSENFYFNGEAILIMHVLFNLFKNSLYFIQKMDKGEIFIWTEVGETMNSLHIKDTAQGISAADLPYIFDQFYSKGTHHGTGIGLSFCKMVMQAHHGNIICRSDYGQFAEFILLFPKI